jgi:hypothetical protein
MSSTLSVSAVLALPLDKIVQRLLFVGAAPALVNRLCALTQTDASFALSISQTINTALKTTTLSPQPITAATATTAAATAITATAADSSDPTPHSTASQSTATSASTTNSSSSSSSSSSSGFSALQTLPAAKAEALVALNKLAERTTTPHHTPPQGCLLACNVFDDVLRVL